TPAISDLRLAQLARVLGISCKHVSDSTLSRELQQTPDHSLCVLVSASTMCHFRARSSMMESLLRKARFVFAYGFAAEDSHVSLACSLTDGLISNFCRFNRNTLDYHVASSHPQITKEFSGLSFGPTNRNIEFGFVPSSKPGTLSSLVSIEGIPFWGLLEKP